MSLVIVGTGTEIGKTVASAVLLARYGASRRLAYWKPVATGSIEGTDAVTVGALSGHCAEILPESYLFREPLSPHLAARLEGGAVDPARVLVDFERHRKGEGLVVEGVGGLLVPLTDEGYLLADLLVAMGLPCLLVALSTLGTINHTLLTLEAMRARGLETVGVVLNGPRNPENRRAIERFGGVEVVAEIERMERVDRESVEAAARRFDEAGRLDPWLPARSG